MKTQTYTIRLRDRGQMTLPQSIRNQLQTEAGDVLTLLQLGDVLILTPRQLRVPLLTEQFTTIMEEENVSLADLLQGLAEERRASQPRQLNGE